MCGARVRAAGGGRWLRLSARVGATWAAGLAVAFALAAAGIAQAQQQGSPVAVTSTPSIGGTPRTSARRCTASGGGAGVRRTRRPAAPRRGGSGGAARATDQCWGCDFQTRNASYRLTTAGRGRVRVPGRATCAGATRTDNAQTRTTTRFVPDLAVRARRPGRSAPRRRPPRRRARRRRRRPSRRPTPDAGRRRPPRPSTPSRDAGADAAARSCRRPRARAGSSGRSRSCA